MVGTKLDGFAIAAWDELLTEEASLFIYRSNKTTDSGLYYKTYDFGRAMTGFAELKITAKREGVLYVIFDELLWHEREKGENYVAFERNACSSVHKFVLRNGGQYNVSTFDPYLMRYALLVCSDGVEAEIALRDYENPNADDFTVECADASIQKIVEAAKATFAQNAVDLLTDFPSRERAGWLSDSYFSSEAEYILTGKNQAEKAFLENYAYADCTGLPDCMVPMCYPSAPYDTYIPNWAMWYVLELEKYANRWGRDEIIAKTKEKADGILRYFKRKENEFGLLENLDGWVFVKWRSANDEAHIKGVNIPSNIAYARCLEGMANLYGYEDLRVQAENICTFIKANAYDGKFFVDNLIRDEQGNLQQSGLLTEVCQYYAFWFNCITKEEYPWLYEELMERLGVNREEGYASEIGTSNVLYGLYMRVDLLMREGKKAKVLDECMRLFLPMAERTGTLWEHNGISASCNHGFASYALKWILFALDK
jgi:alpha-L-rhamnosidase